MQDELAAEELALDGQILGVNEAGAEGGVEAMCLGRDLPLLQDTSTAQVWGAWEVAYRDVVVLDAENRIITIYNLSEHDLGQPANYEALKAILRTAAAGN